MSTQRETHDVTRRGFLHTSLAGAAGLAIGADGLLAATDQEAVVAEIAKQHDATVKMLRDWIALPSIAAENLGYPQGADYMAKLARYANWKKILISSQMCSCGHKPGLESLRTLFGDL